jgi:hypothetical protein
MKFESLWADYIDPEFALYRALDSRGEFSSYGTDWFSGYSRESIETINKAIKQELHPEIKKSYTYTLIIRYSKKQKLAETI